MCKIYFYCTNFDILFVTEIIKVNRRIWNGLMNKYADTTKIMVGSTVWSSKNVGVAMKGVIFIVDEVVFCKTKYVG
jgi:hypothetical protein